MIFVKVGKSLSHFSKFIRFPRLCVREIPKVSTLRHIEYRFVSYAIFVKFLIKVHIEYIMPLGLPWYDLF